MNCSKNLAITINPSSDLVPKEWWTMSLGTPTAEIGSVTGAVLAQSFGSSGDFTSVPGIIADGFQLDVDVAASGGLLCDSLDLKFDDAITIVLWMNTSETFVDVDCQTSFVYRFNLNPSVYFLRLTKAGETGVDNWVCDIAGFPSTTLPSALGWHFYVITFENTTGLLTFEIDRSSSDSSLLGVLPGGAPSVGRVILSSAAGPNPLARQNSIYDEVALFDGILTSDQLDYLYNAGAGRTYPP